jgi:hypothetical protein
MDPVYDDVGYLIDGLQRLNILDTAGFRQFCESFVKAPPHSPWPTGLAIAGFCLNGIHDWTPYVLNGSLVFLLVAWRLLDIESDLIKVAVVTVILLLQLTRSAVLEFDPDFAVLLAGDVFPLSRQDGLPRGSECHGPPRSFLHRPDRRPHLCDEADVFLNTTIMLVAAIGCAEGCRWLVARDELQTNSIPGGSLCPTNFGDGGASPSRSMRVLPLPARSHQETIRSPGRGC